MSSSHETRAIETFLPLTPPAFHLLVSLADEDLHGWAIKKAIERGTEGRIRLGSGTLYGLIKRLLDQELIAPSEDRPPARWDDERRRYYRLTELGRSVARAEAERMEAALDLARRAALLVGEAPSESGA